MKVEKLLEILTRYTKDQDGNEASISVDTGEGSLVVDLGSDIHRFCLDHDECAGRIFGCQHVEEECTPGS